MSCNCNSHIKCMCEPKYAFVESGRQSCFTDTERLEWVIRKHNLHVPNNRGKFGVGHNDWIHDSPRHAIDAAIKEGK